MLKNLIQIDLSHNELDIIQKGTFSHLKRLKVLSLNNNKLSYIEEGSVSENTNHLRRIHFSINRLKSLPAFLSNLNFTLDTVLLEKNMIDIDGLCQAFDNLLILKRNFTDT